MRLKLLLLVLPCFSVFACKEKQKSSSAEEKTPGQATTPPLRIEDSTATYFSISAYFDDQWKTRQGNPYTLLKVVESGGHTDSSFVAMDEALWKSLRAPFDEADISDKKFLGYYKFDMFTDEATETTHLHYEAASPGLLMQKMDVAADMYSNLVKSIYVETRKAGNGRLITQKLQYMPDKLFQELTFEKAEGQPAKNSRIDYRFNY